MTVAGGSRPGRGLGHLGFREDLGFIGFTVHAQLSNTKARHSRTCRDVDRRYPVEWLGPIVSILELLAFGQTLNISMNVTLGKLMYFEGFCGHGKDFVQTKTTG